MEKRIAVALLVTLTVAILALLARGTPKNLPLPPEHGNPIEQPLPVS
ncbi:hypothetical protein [Micromonospora sp. CB01531]|nr:hypothetical protein [Micromonospora sp. CB01531]